MKSVLLAAPFLLGLGVAVAMAKPAQLDDKGVKPLEVPTTTIIPTQELSEDGSVSPSETIENKKADEEFKAAKPLDTGPAPEVMYDTSALPRPVARMRSQLMDAALSGDAERLRMVFESNEVPPTLSFVAIDNPIDFIKESSGDGEGREVLAILADVLDAGFVHVDVGTAQEMYVWPYFARYPLHKLTPEQKVEMFRIVTSGDFAEMELNGVWLFYRVGIGPDGTLHYFVAGE
ncbi:putative cytoplasmic protein [Roseibium sp. TrichSKD4]|uniref:hypothetical protein n=1 Tax=Roseibium sp. TrichSKD4 TaxID=744980 RepID=UPI0001E5611C|nr:hypothetical protein [Roseibium sp. TrichSKD4]EFO34383.1 putative cytoplasmic protein [Roseibium sp. TrichSKD4]